LFQPQPASSATIRITTNIAMSEGKSKEKIPAGKRASRKKPKDKPKRPLRYVVLLSVAVVLLIVEYDPHLYGLC
jgi:hypothetical protein